MLPISLLVFLLLGLSAPYIILLCRRNKTIAEIKKIAAACGFKTKNLKKFTFFARNRGSDYDILFIGRQKVYAVKLWSATHADSTLVICSGSSYYVARGIGEPFEQKGRGEYHFRNLKKTVPHTRLNMRARGGQEIVPILLFYPAYKKVIQNKGKDIFVYEQGDEIFGKRMYFPEGFKGLLFEDADNQYKYKANANK